MKDSTGRTEKQAHKRGADRHDKAIKPEKEHAGHKTSKDIREDRGIRQSKLGRHKK